MPSLKTQPEDDIDYQMIQLTSMNHLLADSIGLKLQAQQASWNYKGENSAGMHKLFEAIALEADGFADKLARRTIELGGDAFGTEGSSARPLYYDKVFPEHHDGVVFVNMLIDTLKGCVDDTRHLIYTSMKMNDTTTAEILNEIMHTLDNRRWITEAYLVVC